MSWDKGFRRGFGFSAHIIWKIKKPSEHLPFCPSCLSLFKIQTRTIMMKDISILQAIGVQDMLHTDTQQHRSKMGTIPLPPTVKKASFLIIQPRDLMIVFLATVSHEGSVGWGGDYTPQVYPATSVQDGYDPSSNDGKEG